MDETQIRATDVEAPELTAIQETIPETEVEPAPMVELTADPTPLPEPTADPTLMAGLTADPTPMPEPTAELIPEPELMSVPELISDAEPIQVSEAVSALAAAEPLLNSNDPPHAKSKPKSSFKNVAAIAALVSVLGGFSLGLGIGVVNTVARMVVSQSAEQPTDEAEAEYPSSTEMLAFNNQASSVINTDENLPGSFSELIELVEPSVVNISSVMSTNQGYFGLPETPRGSGIIFKEDDDKVYIVTNYHVVSNAESVSVSVNGYAPVNAKLIGKEPDSDLAVISLSKVDLAEVGIENVTIAKFGDSDKMLVGDVVLAIGNAMGEGNATTLGIISARNKEIKVEDKVLTVIQTDAAINPGNSGGPLVNMRGEVIGINTAKTMGQSMDLYGSSAEGMGYSIASNIIMPIVDEIMLMKPKAFLGIRGGTVSKDMAEQFDIPELGVFVDDVLPNTAAEIAGLQRTDIITAFKGQAVFTMADLQAAIKGCSVGEEVELKILRDGKTQMTLRVKLLVSDDGSF